MSFENLQVSLLDTSQIPVRGKVSFTNDMVVFSPSVDEDPTTAIQFQKDRIRFITFQDIGYRGGEGPFFEMSFYLKEMGMIYSFGDFKCTQKDDFGDFFLNTYGIKYQIKELVPNGWNWGAIHVDSRVFAMLEPDDPDDLESDEDYVPEE